MEESFSEILFLQTPPFGGGGTISSAEVSSPATPLSLAPAVVIAIHEKFFTGEPKLCRSQGDGRVPGGKELRRDAFAM